MQKRVTLIAAIVAFMLATAATSQTSGQIRSAGAMKVEEASRAILLAENYGAATYARELLEEAKFRLQAARDTAARSNKRDSVEKAAILASEAYHAARAAEAKARWISSNFEVRNLRSDITRFGGVITQEMLAEEASMAINRGTTSKDRMKVAQEAVARAKSAGAQATAKSDLAVAEANLTTVEKILRNQKQSDTADHLSYGAEMLARRAEYLARRASVETMLPDLRMQRTRMAQSASETQALADRKRREEAERQAADLRRQLEEESTNRRAQATEIARLRTQVLENQREIQQRMEQDRTARVEAEKGLDALRREYEAALTAGMTNVQVEELRRRVEDQSIALKTIQEQERASEQTLSEEIRRLREDLDRERQSGKVSTQTLAERQAALTQQQSELERLRKERMESEERRAEIDQRQQAAIAAAEARSRAAEQETAQLRERVAAEQARTQQSQAELIAAREELARRDALEKERFRTMQETIASMAQTRTDARGFVVTLPGIFFDSGKSVLKPGARNVLSKIAEQLRTSSGAKIAVEGHTDSVGADTMNQTLSEKRALAVQQDLVSKGISGDRISATGRGESVPVASNDTASGRQQNRRVELIITQ